MRLVPVTFLIVPTGTIEATRADQAFQINGRVAAVLPDEGPTVGPFKNRLD